MFMIHCLHSKTIMDMWNLLHMQEPLAILLALTHGEILIIISLDSMILILSSLATTKVSTIRLPVLAYIATTGSSYLYRELPWVSMIRGHHIL
jgi:hypothetical protein